MKNLDNNISLAMLKYASELYQNDDDKIITQDELKLFVDSKEDELTSKFGDKFEAMELISTLLKSNFDTEVVENAPETKEEASIEEIKTPAEEETKTEEKQKSVTALQEQIDKYNEDIKNYTSQKETLTTRNEEIKEQLDKEQQKYTSLEAEMAEKNEEYEKIIKKINQVTKKLEEDEQYQQKQAAYEAMSKFDPEKDGSWDNFLENYIKTNNPTSKYKGQLQGLITSSDFLSSDLKTLGAKLSSQGQNIATLSDEYQQNAETIEDCSAKAQEAMLNLQAIQMTTKAEMGFQMGGCCSKDPSENWSYEDYERYMEEWQWGGGQEDLPETAPNYDIDYEWSMAGEGAFATKGADGQMHVYQPDTTTMAGGAQRYAAAARTADDGGWDYVGYKSGYLLCGEGGKQQDCYDRNGCCTGTIEVRSTSSPLSLDINGDGVKTSSNIIDYDIDGDGVVDKINDSADAVLVFDKDGDGISGEDGSECFGDNTDIDGDGVKDGYKDGFEALKAMAKKEGLIGENDSVLDENDLKTLEDKYGLKIKTKGYNSSAQSLADVGITEINLADTDETTMLDNFDGNGNQLMKQHGATFKVNGETREYADIWHKKLDEEDINAQQTKTSDIQNNQNTIQQNQEKQEEGALNLNFDISSADFLNDKIKANQRKADNEIEEAQKTIKKSTSYKFDKDIEEAFNKKMMELQEQAQKMLKEKEEKEERDNPFR